MCACLQVRFARSHKITRHGLQQLCEQLSLEALEVVRCRGVAQSLLTGLLKAGSCVNGQ